ncbi:MAG: phage tail assembly protein [Candidatus Poribacteria bacterium]|nr:phage tail assembly protein [Candidatus Poribacteria bacterium]
MTTQAKQNEKIIEIGKVFTRDDNLDIPDPKQGDPPLLSADEQGMPVEVELIRPIEVDGQKMKSIVIDPSKMSTDMMLRHQQQQGTDALKTLRWVCECTQLAEHDIKKMLPADYRRVATAVRAFT